MQCPNCGKEAINVNGRYVCLDCGIEINSQDTSAPAAPPMPILTNHNQVTADISGAVQTAPTQSNDPFANISVTTEEPLAPSTTPPQQTTVEPSISAPQNPVVPQAEVPSEPPKMPDISWMDQPQEPAAPAPAAQDQKPAEPLHDYYVNTLNQASSAATTGPVADFPEIEPKNEGQTASVPVETTTPTVDLNMDSAFMSGSPEPMTSPEAVAVPAVAENPTQPQPAATQVQDYFQPSTMNITPAPIAVDPAPMGEPSSILATPAEPEAETQAGPPVVFPEQKSFNIPVTAAAEGAHPEANFQAVPAEEPALPTAAPLQAQPAPSISPAVASSGSLPIETGVAVAPAVPAPNANEAAQDMFGEQQSAPVVPEVAAVGSNPQTSQGENSQIPASNLPGTSNMPSAESVFGPQSQSAELNTNPPKKSKKKILFVILGIILALALIGGGVAGYFALSGNNSQQKQQKNGGDSTALIELSQSVAQAMDPATNVTSTFEQSLDFSKVTPQSPDGDILKDFIAKPATNQGSWQIDQGGNVSFTSQIGTTTDKRIYIKGENNTYTFAADANQWVSTPGLLISSAPTLYPADKKGYLFYISRIDDITDQGQDSIDGISLNKLKIKPKKEVVEELLSQANSAFSKISYAETDVSAIDLFAWVNSDNQIVKVTLAGNVNIKSNLYTGAVAVQSSATYKYAPVNTIVKP